ncbi:MAG: ferrous iron transport protein A [Kiritimatiellia bacterium]
MPAEKPQVWVPGKICTLSEVKSGHRIKIMAVRIADPARERLYAQGFLENRQGQILHNDHRGRVMLRLEGEIYLLGRLETAQIQVREYLLSR